MESDVTSKVKEAEERLRGEWRFHTATVVSAAIALAALFAALVAVFGK